MARDQRVLKLFIRLMLPVVALGGFGSIASVILVFSNTPKRVSTMWSSDLHYRASLLELYGASGCAGGRSSIVLVERRTWLFYTGQFAPFCFEGPPERISIQWKNPNTLAIDCSGCDGNYGYANQNWGKLHFVYDLEKP